MTKHVRVDSLVRGLTGSTEHVETMRVYHVDGFGNVSGINDAGRQRQMHTSRLAVLEGPRAEKARTDIPERLRS